MQGNLDRIAIIVSEGTKVDSYSNGDDDHDVIHRNDHSEMAHPLVQKYLLTNSMEQSPSWEANWFCS